MILSHYSKALNDLIDASNLSDPVRMLTIYSAAKVIAGDMENSMGVFPPDERHIKHDYILEKLSLFIEYFGCAAIPIHQSHKTPSEWLEAARHNLLKVTIDTAD